MDYWRNAGNYIHYHTKTKIALSKRIVILGAGESGVGAAKLALKQGFEVFVSDFGKIKEKYKNVLSQIGAEWEEEKHTEEKILSTDEIIKSPGIPEKAEIIKMAKEKGISIISEIEFAGRFSKAKMIGITGSNGKTTTTLLTYHIFKKAGLNVGLAGNVGESLAKQVAEEDKDFFIIELSSFQLDDMHDFKLDVAILLNITPDHLDRYDYKMENYVKSKFRIIQNQTENDAFIYWMDDPEIKKQLEKVKVVAKKYPFSITQIPEEGAYKENESINVKLNNKLFTMSIYELALQGNHNLYNTMAAAVAARIFDIRKDKIRESLSDFQNVEHRLEFVANIHGIEFINDSKATNVNSTWFALESMQKPIVWIVGGVDKGNDYSMLDEMVKEKVKAIVCLGKDNKKIIKAFSDKIEIIVEATSAADAVKKSYELANKGEIVLLSPCCASFDLFENYEDRGHQFKNAVKGL